MAAPRPTVLYVSRPVQPDPKCPSCAILSKRVAELTEVVKELQRTSEEQAKEIARLTLKGQADVSELKHAAVPRPVPPA